MFRIRFHGRGGQGMKTASRILGSAFFLAGYEVQDAPRYGAERRGAPIFAYVRADDRPINERGIIKDPDLVVVADDSLVSLPAAGVLDGLDDHTVLLINSHEPVETWARRLNHQGTVLTLPAVEEGEDRADLRYAGAVCAAAAARLTGAVELQAVEQAIRDELGMHGEAVVARNLELARAAWQAMADHSGAVSPRRREAGQGWVPPDWIEPLFEDVHTAAPVIRGGVTSAAVKTGAWRTMRPVIDLEHCNGCWWVCSTFCPDGAILVDEKSRPRIDYDHCKGCLICVAQCPAHAISAVAEHAAAPADEVTT